MHNEKNKELLQVRNLEVVYKTDEATVHAVNNISFEIKKGEVLGLVGETGAGKTTTALSLLRLLPERTGKITNGSIVFDGKELLDQPESSMRNIRGGKIAMIFQDPMSSLNPTMTIGAQISEALFLHNAENSEGGHEKMSRTQIEKRTDEVLELVGIPASRKREYPHQFSGGMKQRVVIAMALACEPRLLIADEPTTALDVTIQAQVLSMIKSLQQRLDTAMLMITHDLGIVAQTCDNVAVMYAGEIIEYGTAEDIFTGECHHPYTSGLFNSIPNIHVTERRLKPIDGLMPDPTETPPGCKFAPRCPKCTEQCRKEHPKLFRKNTHLISCHLLEDTMLEDELC